MPQEIKDSGNFSQALWLGFGQFGNYFIAFISAAILSRYLLKEDYGTYRQILYVYVTLMSIFTIGLPTVFSYFIPRLNKRQQKTLINGMNKLFLVLGALFSFALYVLAKPISELLKNPELATGLKLFSPFPFFTLPSLGVEGIYTALRKTKTVAIYQLVSKLIMFLFIITPVILIRADYKLAIIGWGLASFLTFLMAMYLKITPYQGTEKELIPNMYKEIFDYSLPLMGAFIAGFFISSADQFFISRYYGTEAFAEYSNGSLSIPIVMIIAASIKKVLIPIFSKANFEDKINNAVQTYVNAVNKSINLVFPLIIYAIFFSDDIVVIIYGNSYLESGSYMKYHLIRDFLEVLPYFSVFLALGMSRIYFYIHIVGALYIWAVGFIIVKSGMDPTMIVLARSMFYVFSTVFALLFLYKKRKINLFPASISRQISKVLIHSVICAYLVFFIFNYFQEGELSSFIVISITIPLYYLLIVVTGFLIKIKYLESAYVLLNKIRK